MEVIVCLLYLLLEQVRLGIILNHTESIVVKSVRISTRTLEIRVKLRRASY